jgi:acyl-CoA synthetase (AMP-forming)/AMP-acid ligase II
LINTLRDLFQESVNRAPTSLFLADDHQQLTYEQAYRKACQRASILLKNGAHPQDRVFILDEDPLETALWILACNLAGAIFVVLHHTISVTRIQHLLQEVKPIGFIDYKKDHLWAYQSEQSLRFFIDTREINDTELVERLTLPSDIIATDPAFLLYTSGSTGKPKAVICPHRTALYVISSINAFLPNGPQERIGLFLSLSFVYGLYQIYLAMQVQAAVIFLGRFRHHLDLLQKLEAQRISALPAVRSVLASFARLSPDSCKVDSIKYISSTGDYLPPSLIAKIVQRFPQSQLFSMYGLSEGGRVLYMPPDRITSKPDAVGQPVPGTRAFIVNEKGDIVPEGTVGELVVEGPGVMGGYWEAPQETGETFTHGPYGQPRLRTGDIFFQDTEGDFHFVSRKQGMVKSGGFRIGVHEVEAAMLAADSAIQECIVYAVEDDVLGQALQADILVNDPSHTVREVFRRCREVMDPHMIPVKIQIVDVLPTVTSGGKYNRRQAKED